jgi:metallophosphoesterase superfamily enzyme
MSNITQKNPALKNPKSSAVKKPQPASALPDDDHCRTRLGGEEALLLPQKAVYLPGCKTLVVADVHIGKAAAFRSRSFFAPDGLTARDLDLLTFLLHDHMAERLVVLGDLVHSQDGLTRQEVELFDNFRHRHQSINMTLILGNHDRKARMPASWKLDQVRGHIEEGPFVFCHDYEDHKALNAVRRKTARAKKNTEESGKKKPYVLSGHIHPAVVLHGRGKQSERLPCFWLRRTYAVLPAFGVFTGCYSITPTPADKVFVVAKDVVLKA